MTVQAQGMNAERNALDDAWAQLDRARAEKRPQRRNRSSDARDRDAAARCDTGAAAQDMCQEPQEAEAKASGSRR